MTARKRKLPLAMLALAVLAAFGLSACGGADTRVTTGTYAGEAGANAPYLNVGPLLYEVQLSRQLNPFDAEDAGYLEGVESAEDKLEPGQEWFAVFLQVYNHSNHELTASDQITVSDTQGNVYSPIAPNQTNLFAYRAGGVPPKSQLPVPGTPADMVGSQGQMLLFKIEVESLNNRPLMLNIVDPEAPSQSASVELDV
jgi:hypothetical protein